MRCKKVEFTQDSIFHIYNHAIDNYDLFYDDIDYQYLLNIINTKIKNIPG
jgi:hypothetical protein